jgi:hypothetical protein
MKRVTFPLNLNMTGPDVKNLQEGLLVLLENDPLGMPPGRLIFVRVRLQDDYSHERFGDATAEVVSIFQQRRNVGDGSGDVDQATAEELNTELEKLGVLDPAPPPAVHSVMGLLADPQGTAVPGLLVRAAHRGTAGERALGQATAGGDGRYAIECQVPAGVTSVTLVVRAFGSDGHVLVTSDPRPNAGPLETVNLTVPSAGPPPAAKHHLQGHVVLDNGVSAQGLRLRLYRVAIGGVETRLAEVTAAEDGSYRLGYDTARGGALQIRAVDGADKETAISDLLYDLGDGDPPDVNLVAPGSLLPEPSEYRRLADDVKAHYGEMADLAKLRESDERRDLSGLSSETTWDARLLALAADAARQSADPGNAAGAAMSQEILYGLFRVGLPRDPGQLAVVPPTTVRRALEGARKGGIIDLDDDGLAKAVDQFAAFAKATRLAMTVPGSRNTYAQFLDSSGVTAGGRAAFEAVLLAPGMDARHLWDRARENGVSNDDVDRLRQQGRLAHFTGGSLDMMKRLAPEQELARWHTAAHWESEIDAAAGIVANGVDGLSDDDLKRLDAVIPPAYEGGDIEARRKAYADDLGRKVRLAYPTEVITNIVGDAADTLGLGTVRAPTHRLLDAATGHGFHIGHTPIQTFVRDHPQVLDGLPAADVDAALHGAKALQRVYQLTPSNDEMPILMGIGLTSAHDITAIPRDVFLDRFGHLFRSRERAVLVYRKAEQVSSVTYNLFGMIKKLDAEIPLPTIAAPVDARQSARNELIKQFPTMESLFGSMDYCECEHCRSVLSPAAYLVDLLQFLDPEDLAWKGFLDEWRDAHGGVPYTDTYMKPFDALVERRPDIPNIPLTCENTNTALPYIDVVNEVLEYYVANDRLDAGAVRDTGAATSEELLAEPQNVVAGAYDVLRAGRYPMCLPFDLWTETVRAFSNYFDTSLSEIMDVFRRGDDLFSSAVPYDRFAVFAEQLGLTVAETAIYTEPDPLATWYALYGYLSAEEASKPPVDKDSGQRFDLNSAKTLARRLGVTYKELVAIIQTSFVNPDLHALTVLRKLGITASDVVMYRQHKDLYATHGDLIGKPVGTLGDAARRRYDELSDVQWQWLLDVHAIRQRLDDAVATYGALGPVRQWMEHTLDDASLDKVLVLADPDAGCDFDQTTVRYATGGSVDGIALLRINLFVRLWRKLGWTIDETDGALRTFVPRSAPFDAGHLAARPLRTALVYIAHLKELDDRVRLGKGARARLLTLWSDIATTGPKPLYEELFLTKGILKDDPVFDHPLGRYLDPAAVTAMAEARTYTVEEHDVPEAERLDPTPFAGAPQITLSYDAASRTQTLSYRGVLGDADKKALRALAPAPVRDRLTGLLDTVQEKGRTFSLVRGHMPTLQGALGVTADEIRQILEDNGASIDQAALTLGKVSTIYRYALLARALKLPVCDLIVLRRLSGLDPFQSLHADTLTRLEDDYPFKQTLRFVRVAQTIKDSGLTVEDLDYLLRHRFDATGKYRPDRAANLAFIKRLSEGIRSMQAEHAVPDDPAELSDEVLRQKLGLVLPADVVELFLAMLNDTVEFTAVKSGVDPSKRLYPTTFAGADAIRALAYDEARQEQTIVVRGVLVDAEKKALADRYPLPEAGPHVSSDVLSDLLDDVQGQAWALFEKHLQKAPADQQPATGFLEKDDFDVLFAPAPADPVAARKQREEQRTRLAGTFFPYLQRRLIRQFVVEALTVRTGGDPDLVDSLVCDPRLLPLAADTPLVDSLVVLATRGVSAAFYDSKDLTGTPQKVAPIISSADTALKDVKGPDEEELAPANSVRFDGYLEVPTPGAYRFFVELEHEKAEATLRFEHLPEPELIKKTAGAPDATFSEFLELKAGVPYRYSVEFTKLTGGRACMLVQGENLPKGDLARLTLYLGTAVAAGEDAILVLAKVVQVVQSLGLSEREIRYVATHAADFDGVDLKALPTHVTGDTAAEREAATRRFAWLLRLVAYAQLKRELSLATDELIDVFEANGLSDTDRLVEHVYPILANLTRRDVATVKDTAEALFGTPSFATELPVRRLWDALQLVTRFGVPAGALPAWTRVVSVAATGQERFEAARDLKEALRARFSPEVWRRVAQSVFDKIRRRQRDALVAWVMHHERFSRVEQLFEYFLMDPGMEPVVRTSRIRLAIASVQIFVQRCLMNLERHVHPSAINARQWEWMKRYRVWEANRKIFLYPENWLEPEFRDDKTHLFKELEGELFQGDVSDDLVEDALYRYVSKLDELARLNIMAMHVEDQADDALNTLHVIGRTFSEPPKYFYRRYAHEMWTPWEPITAEVQGDHIAPVVWRGRLCLFWVTFMERPKQPDNALPTLGDTDTSLTAVTVSSLATGMSATQGAVVGAVLHWSTYRDGEWSAQESSALSERTPGVSVAPGSKFDPAKVFIYVSLEAGGAGALTVHLAGFPRESTSGFVLRGRHSVPEWRAVDDRLPHHPFSGDGTDLTRCATEYHGEKALTASYARHSVSEAGSKVVGPPVKDSQPIFQTIGPYGLLTPNNDIAVGDGELSPLVKPAFVMAGEDTLFLEPEVSEVTMKEWREWVPQQPSPTWPEPPEWQLPDWWRDFVQPQYPWRRFPLPLDPLDPVWCGPGGSRPPIVIRPIRDWVVLPTTVLERDGEVIGSGGRIRLDNPALDPLASEPRRDLPRVGGFLHTGTGTGIGGTSPVARIGLNDDVRIVGGGGLRGGLERFGGRVRVSAGTVPGGR